MPRVIKTTWTKESAVLLINIVKDVEQKVLNKELQVGKENEKTKWDYVADWLHEVSQLDATKTSTNCQYKFWELNRHYKFLLKGAGGKAITEEKDGAMYAALKEYYDLFPPVKKKSKTPQRGIRDQQNPQIREGGKGADSKSAKKFEHQNLPPKQVSQFSSCNEAGSHSGDESGGSPGHTVNGEPLGQVISTGHSGDQPNEGSCRSPYLHPSGMQVEQQEMSSSSSWREQSGKRKAEEPNCCHLVDRTEDQECNRRLKRMVDKMARLTSYLEWKQTGVGEKWRCDITDRIEGHQKRDMGEPGESQNKAGIMVPDEIETALRDDIFTYWNQLEDKQPTEEECRRYFQNMNAMEVTYKR